MMRIFNLSIQRKSLKALPVAVGMALVLGCASVSPVAARNNQALAGSGGHTSTAASPAVAPVSPSAASPASVSTLSPASASGNLPVNASSSSEPLPGEPTSALPPARALVLSNMEILGGGHLHHLSSRPRVFGPLKLKKHQQSPEERFLYLLFLVCALIGGFIAILALRSIPPTTSKRES